MTLRKTDSKFGQLRKMAWNKKTLRKVKDSDLSA